MEPSDDNYEMTQGEIAAALNEWMRRYIADPAAFEADFQTVTAYLAETNTLEAPSYGVKSAAYLLTLHRELNA